MRGRTPSKPHRGQGWPVAAAPGSVSGRRNPTKSGRKRSGDFGYFDPSKSLAEGRKGALSRKQTSLTSLTSQNRSVMLRATDLRRILRIGRRASRTACDAERRTIVAIVQHACVTDPPDIKSLPTLAKRPTLTVECSYVLHRLQSRSHAAVFGRGFRWVENSMRA